MIVRALEEYAAGPACALKLKTLGWAFQKKKREAMFEKFVRHDLQALRGISGAGLGLAIAKRLVEMMNGKIGLRSGADGKGSLAWFTLPLAEVEKLARGNPGERARNESSSWKIMRW